MVEFATILVFLIGSVKAASYTVNNGDSIQLSNYPSDDSFNISSPGFDQGIDYEDRLNLEYRFLVTNI